MRFAFCLVALAGCSDRPEDALQDDGWRGASMTDSSGTVRASVVSRDAIRDPGERARPSMLLIRCDGDGASVYVDWRQDLALDTVEATLSFDGGPPRVERWATSSDRTAAGRWTSLGALPLLDELASHDRLTVTVEADGERSPWTFALDGLQDAAAPIRDACPDRPATSDPEAPVLTAAPSERVAR